MSVVFVEKPNTWVDVWTAGWCQNWKIGDVINTEKEQWQSREYNGKTYWTLKAPASARGGVSQGQFTTMEEQLNLLASRVAGLEKRMAELEIVEVAEEIPPIESITENMSEEVNVNDIPF